MACRLLKFHTIEVLAEQISYCSLTCTQENQQCRINKDKKNKQKRGVEPVTLWFHQLEVWYISNRLTYHMTTPRTTLRPLFAMGENNNCRGKSAVEACCSKATFLPDTSEGVHKSCDISALNRTVIYPHAMPLLWPPSLLIDWGLARMDSL